MCSFSYDGEGVDDSATPWLVTEPGEKCLRIVKTEERASKNGEPQVIVDFTIIGGLDDGKGVRQYVTFLPKTKDGARIAVHFLKCIGEPVKGLFQPAKWTGRHVLAFVKQDEYQGKKKNAIAWMEKWEKDIPNTTQKLEDLDEIPF